MMMFRPASMNWVDLLVERDSVSDALDVLGRLRIIELRQYDRRQVPFEIIKDGTASERLIAVEKELQSVESYLPAPNSAQVSPLRRHAPTPDLLPVLEQTFRTWIDEAAPLIDQLKGIKTNLEELRLLDACLESLPEGELDPSLLSDDSSRWFTPFLVIATEDELEALRVDSGRFVLRTYPVHGAAIDDQGLKRAVMLNGVTEINEIKSLEQHLRRLGMRFVRIPAGLKRSSHAALQQVREWIEERELTRDKLLMDLETLNQRTQIAGWFWLLKQHRWVNNALSQSLIGKRFVWLGGWVPASRYDELVAALRRSEVPFLINCEPATGHGVPPVEFDNPRWVRRFETFVRAFGVPAANEVDPSPVLAIMAPLMFGYMFGDVGQGAVLALIGWTACKRFPVLGLLVPGGISAIAFGFLYGSVFCNEHLLQPLWIRPMEQPLPMMLWPLGFGFLVIFLSMMLGAVQAHWRGGATRWWAVDAPVVGLFVGLAMSVVSVTIAVLTCLVSVLWLVVGAGAGGYRAGGIAGALTDSGKNLLELIEITVQLAINTLSFVRLGAFALAHAGLGAAVIALSAIPETLFFKALVFVLGNVVVIVLEGLVVGIQTTRLVMFEFFRRFLGGGGRLFRPLALPNGSDLRHNNS